jgi:hypothetical protein
MKERASSSSCLVYGRFIQDDWQLMNVVILDRNTVELRHLEAYVFPDGYYFLENLDPGEYTLMSFRTFKPVKGFQTHFVNYDFRLVKGDVLFLSAIIASSTAKKDFYLYTVDDLTTERDVLQKIQPLSEGTLWNETIGKKLIQSSNNQGI